ncbi:unnamed protein product [Boreogadus saida]
MSENKRQAFKRDYPGKAGFWGGWALQTPLGRALRPGPEWESQTLKGRGAGSWFLKAFVIPPGIYLSFRNNSWNRAASGSKALARQSAITLLAPPARAPLFSCLVNRLPMRPNPPM